MFSKVLLRDGFQPDNYSYLFKMFELFLHFFSHKNVLFCFFQQLRDEISEVTAELETFDIPDEKYALLVF